MALTPAGNQVNCLLLLLLLHQERGDYLASTLETRYRTTRETRSLANPSQPEKHNLCLSISYYYTYHIYTTSTRKERHYQAYSLFL